MRDGSRDILLGPCPLCGTPTFDYGGGWRCRDWYCSKSANNPATSVGSRPKWWNTDINIQLDGNMWCAFRDGFVNLQESNAGFGSSPQEAVEDLERTELR